jgi:hypothetical protein
MGLLPPLTGPKITPLSPELTSKIYFPPWKGIQQSGLSDGSTNALPRRIVPVPVVSISDKEDDLFNKGMMNVCPNAYKKQEKISKENIQKDAYLFDTNVRGMLDKYYPVKDYYGTTFPHWDMNSIGYFSDEYKCYKSITGIYPPGNNAEAV